MNSTIVSGMFNILKRPGWYIPEKLVTPEEVFLNRRRFLNQLGIASAGVLAMPLAGCSRSGSGPAVKATEDPKTMAGAPSWNKYPAKRNPDFSPDWTVTEEELAASFNNYYEFIPVKEVVYTMVDKFVISPWPIEIGGLIEKPMTLDVAELIDKVTLEERIYRFRCVEAWSMVVPWTGFPLSKLVEMVSPKAEAKFVRFETFNRPDQAPGMQSREYPWPYTEGLTIEEAMNPLTLVTTGIYGHPLPKQHGAPLRIVVPWKYGYKSIKSIVKIEFVREQPATLWQTMAPDEYPFESNVDPDVPHPRWSQATERVLGSLSRVRTLKYNGYGDHVAKLYPSAKT